MKVAFIGNIYAECGIATYNELLFRALQERVEILFFAEENGNEDSKDIFYCWNRKDFPKFKLLDKIDSFKPDVVFFSHEFGLFPKAYHFSTLVSYFRLRGYKVVSLFHSIYEHHKDKSTTESICKNVVVHTDKAKEALLRKGLNKKCLHVVPHGCSFADSTNQILPPLWNHIGNKHTILQAGFLFEYKNHLGMLSIVAELKKKYPDVIYIICASENPHCQKEHDNLYKKLVDKIEKLGIIHNVIIDKGFVSNEVLMSYIRTSSVFVLPYNPNPEFDVYAASGMARVVLRTSTSLITSNANLFDSMDSVVIKAESQQDWVNRITEIFEGKVDTQKMHDTRTKFIEQNEWIYCAEKLIKIFKGAI